MARGKALSTVGTKISAKKFAESADCLSEVVSNNFWRLAGEILNHSLVDPTIQFEAAIVMSGMCNPTVGAMAGLMRVIRHKH